MVDLNALHADLAAEHRELDEVLASCEDESVEAASGWRGDRIAFSVAGGTGAVETRLLPGLRPRIGTVKSRVRRGLGAMRDRLGVRGQHSGEPVAVVLPIDPDELDAEIGQPLLRFAVLLLLQHLALDLHSLLSFAEAATIAAIERKESRGGHTRDDYPNTDPKFAKTNIVIRRKNGDLTASQEPLPEMPDELKILLEEKK